MKRFLILFCLLLWPAASHAALVEQTVEYKHGQVPLEGYLVYDETSEAKRPGILVVHEWKGLGEYAKRRANQLAELGYVAFAVDMYGKDVRPSSHEEAAKVSGLYRSDRELTRSRILAAYEALKMHPLVDDAKIGAIGYCFGGMTVLELARSGADVRGVVSFHGSLANPTPENAKNIKAKVLVLHGADDKFVSPEEIAAFKKEMAEAGADMQFIEYPGAVHSFTVKDAGDDPSKGMAYNADADEKSWQEMQAFFRRVFKD